MDNPLTIHGQSLDCPWTVHGLSMDSPLTIHGQSMDSPWTIHGQSMDSPWTVHGQSMDSPWTIHGQSIMDDPWTVRRLAGGLPNWLGWLGLACWPRLKSRTLTKRVRIANCLKNVPRPYYARRANLNPKSKSTGRPGRDLRVEVKLSRRTALANRDPCELFHSFPQ